jgi:restriction system protein
LICLAVLLAAAFMLALLRQVVKADDKAASLSIARQRAARERREEELHLQLAELLVDHDEALMARLRQAFRRDAYGTLLPDKMTGELAYFFDVVVLKQIEMTGPADAQILSEAFSNWVHNLDLEKIERGYNKLPTRNNGLAFERQVASTLADLGYSVSFTPESGDQGVDLIASRQGRRIAIQCKDYQAPVGNDAVQQVFSGAAFYGAEVALVIAPHGFTAAARQLANSLGVHCGARDELPSLLARAG